VSAGCASPPAPFSRLVYEGPERLRGFNVDGKPARIHTQGLFVTDRHLYVTGRLETKPKRAVFLRIGRGSDTRVEHIDLTPAAAAEQKTNGTLDHPGGFDFDGRAFWIPVSASSPHSETTILRVACRPRAALKEANVDIAFRVDDHIGALAFDRWSRRLYGANWDTKTVYVWTPDGTQIDRIGRDAMVTEDPGWALAIQDFKCVSKDRILAGGIDENPARAAAAPRAVVELLDVRRRERLARARLADPPGYDGTVTREGLAIQGDHVFLLPADLGQDVNVFRYRQVRLTGPRQGG